MEADLTNPALANPASTNPALPGPLSIIAEVTHRCPLHCLYCSNPLELKRGDAELTTGEWNRVFEQAAGLGVLQMHLTGGEPLARPDLAALVAAGWRRGAVCQSDNFRDWTYRGTSRQVSRFRARTYPAQLSGAGRSYRQSHCRHPRTRPQDRRRSDYQKVSHCFHYQSSRSPDEYRCT